MTQLELRRRSHELANAHQERDEIRAHLEKARADLAKARRELLRLKRPVVKRPKTKPRPKARRK
jgi:uncharacterized protein (DUF3084 family)